MSDRPRIDPGLLASVSESAPGRLVRSLDKDPALAERWRWERAASGAVTVRTEGGETVTLAPDPTGVLSEPGQLACTCLLAPRCLHLLAVLTRLEPSEEPGGGAAPAATATAVEAAPTPAGLELSAEQRRAARELYRAGVELLGLGASAAGTVVQTELLRAVHSCRGASLPRAASAGLRVLRSIRDLREERPEFSLPELARDLLELLEVGRALEAEGPVPPRYLGTARRAYQEIGHLRLHGLFCEPVIAGAGASGVVTTLCDESGQLYTVSDVQPGDPARARGAYDKGVRLGETSLSHRELCREGLFVQGATVSADGRLGSGASVQAVRAGESAWSAAAPGRLFATPIAEQVARAYAAAALPVAERPAGSDLVLAHGVVLGAAGDALLVKTADELALRLVAASDHAQLPLREVLRLLARAPGLGLSLVGRLRLEQPRTLALLAVGPAPEGEPQLPERDPNRRLELPAPWRGRCNLGLDALQATHFRPGLAAPRELAAGSLGAPVPDPLAGLRRRLHRIALGGRATLPPEAGAELEREARRLGEAMLPTAAALLRALQRGAVACERTLAGRRREGDPAELARAYLAAGAFERACSRALQERAWLDPR
jgi:hypothetical protein